MDVLEPEVLMSCVGEVLGLDPRIFTICGSSGVERGVVSELLWRYGGFTQVQIGELSGDIDYSAVSRLGYRLKKRMEHDKRVREQHVKAEGQVRDALSNVEI